jgi:putative ABC transport system permease protein
VNTLLQDLRYAIRALGRRPGFAAVVVACLALGIGANTAIFSVINAVVLRPLDFQAPEQLVSLESERELPAYNVRLSGAALPNFRDWEQQSTVFDGLGAFSATKYTLSGVGAPVQLEAAFVTEGFFPMLGAQPALGRLLTADDVEGKSGNVVVLGDKLWRKRFDADPDVIGRTIVLDQEGFAVVGVLPPGFRFPYEVRDAQLWTPVPAESQMYGRRSSSMLRVAGRLKPGVSLAQAQTQMTDIAARLAQEYPNVNSNYRIGVVSMRESLVGESRSALWLLLGAVGLVLLIACANIANLYLAQGLQRRRELAVRAALGAARLRLMRQLLTESVLVGLVGGALGVALAFWALDALVALLPADIPRLDEVAIDGRVLAFAVAVAMLTGLLFGLPAAIGSARADLHGALKSGVRSSGVAVRHRLQSTLVVSEIALATTLLIGAALLVRSFHGLTSVPLGYVTDHVLTFQMDVGATTPHPQRADFFEQLCERLRGLPTVRNVCLSNGLPLTRRGMACNVTILDAPDPEAAETSFTMMRAVSPSYFATLGIPLLRGRLFDDNDARSQVGAMLIDESTARRYWPDGDPLGHMVCPGASIGPKRDYEIVGVVGDVRDNSLEVKAWPNIYVPYRQFPDGSVLLSLRTGGNPLALIDNIRGAVAELTANDAPFAFATMEQYYSDSVAHRRYPMLLLGLFAALALLLAVLGIYGVLAFSVTQRTHELGVRLALGARAGQVLRLVLWQGLRLAIIGVGLGLTGAYAGTRLLRAWLFGVEATDPPTFAVAAVVFVGIALLACLIPARRATKVDPLVALRCE